MAHILNDSRHHFAFDSLHRPPGHFVTKLPDCRGKLSRWDQQALDNKLKEHSQPPF